MSTQATGYDKSPIKTGIVVLLVLLLAVVIIAIYLFSYIFYLSERSKTIIKKQSSIVHHEIIKLDSEDNNRLNTFKRKRNGRYIVPLKDAFSITINRYNI